MVYKKSVPQPTNNLDDSQVDLLNNFTQLDDTFDIDHVPFSDTTADNGRHKFTTFVQQSVAPSTAADQVKGYSLEPTSDVGTLQFSRGESDAVPTPVTGKHLSGTINLPTATSSDVLDFSGLTRSIGVASAISNVGSSGGPSVLYYFAYDGTTPMTTRISSVGGGGNIGSLTFVVSGTKLQVRNSNNTYPVNNVTWSLSFIRVE